MSLQQRLEAKIKAEANPEAAQLAALPLEIEKAKLKLQGDRLKTKEALQNAEDELKATKERLPYSPSEIIALQQKIEGIKEGLKLLDKLEREDFPR